MSQKENTTAVQLVKLIMSSRSVDEKLQHETIQCLKSNPGVLLSVLKSCGRNEDTESQKIIEGSSSFVVNVQGTNQEHYRTSNQPKHDTSPKQTLDSLKRNENYEENDRVIKISTVNCSSNVSQEQTKTTDNERTMNSNKNDEENVRAINMSTDDNYYFSNISQEQTIIHDNERTRHNDKTESHKPCKRVNDLIDNDIDDKESEPKKRKSKYSNIQGDLSHIRRDPKCGKRQLSRQKRKKRKPSENDSKKIEKIKDATETQENAKLARKLIETLKNPKSVRHQECILELLREDENLRKAFMEEKAKMGKQIVRVYRRSTSENETKHFRKEFDREMHSLIAENSQTNCQQLCSSEICSPCSSQSIISYPEVGDTDTFINSLIASLKENESEMYQKPVQEQQVDGIGMLLQLNSLSSNETNFQDLQTGCSETTDVLYMATKQIGGLSSTACRDSSALLFNMDDQQTTSSKELALQFNEQQPSTSTAFVFPEDNNQASSSNAFAFHVVGQQESAIQTFDRISTDNNSSMNGHVFDASCQDQLQDLSKELYIMNNTQPKNC